MPLRITSGRPWETKLKYSRAIRYGNFVETCLTSPSAADGSILHPGDVYRQTRVCLEIVGAALAQAGMGYPDIVRSRIYMLDTRRWEEAGRAHAEIVGEARPVLSFLGLANFWHPDIAVEVEVLAMDARAEEGGAPPIA